MSRVHSFYTENRKGRHGGEIDLRQELQSMYYGSGQEVPKSHPLLFRRARKDSNGRIIPCDCVDSLTHEPDIDISCPICMGLGYFWDEEWIDARRREVRPSQTGYVGRDIHTEAGIVNIKAVIYYFEYSVEPTTYDRIVEVKLDTEGEIVQPVTRTRIYKPDSILNMRSDYGRTEFFAVSCLQKNSIKLAEDL